jgi:hypothetical protein
MSLNRACFDLCIGNRNAPAITRCCRLLFGLLIFSLLLPPLSFSQTEAPAVAPANPAVPEANPARPTVSTPATLTPVGYIQLETGALGASESAELSWRYGFNEVMKLTVAPRLQLIVSDEPFDRYNVGHGARSGNGTAEVFLGVQAVALRGEGVKPTIAASYYRRVYDDGVPDLDIGSARNSFLLLASADVKGFHYDANALFNEQTDGAHRLQTGQTLSISHALIGKFTLSGEIWHFTQPYLRGHAVGNLWALSYAPKKNLVFDVGFNHGLTDTSTRWEAFAGFTYLLPRQLFHGLWMNR